MSNAGIGVQQIRPRASTDWQGGHHSPDRQNDKQAADEATESENAQPSAPPGLGKIVDKSV